MATDACAICNADGQQQHYFVEFGSKGPVRYFYTTPLRSMLIKTFDDFISYKPHFDVVTGPFIVCLDCKGLDLKYCPPLEVSKRIIHYMTYKMQNMQALWVINPNAIAFMVLKIVKPFMSRAFRAKLRIVKESEFTAELLQLQGLRARPWLQTAQ
jgi:hypothetical protein